VLDLRRLGVFAAVAEHGSFSVAASSLGYSQSAVSHHIAQLELEIGGRLLERGPAGTSSLTAVGQVLLVHATRLLADADSAEHELAAVLQRGAGRVAVGSFATASATFVVDAIAALHAQRPEVAITLVEADGPELVSALRGRRVDVAVVFDEPAHPLPGHEEYERVSLLEDEMLVALPAGHPVADRASVDLGALRDEPWIEGAGATTAASLMLATAADRAGFAPRIAFNSGDYAIVQRLVAAGVGVALVPRLAVAEQPGVAVRPLAEPLRRHIALLLRPGQRTDAVEQVAAALSRAAAAR
jgi:DNA-binding transcriptional LysR family regulator